MIRNVSVVLFWGGLWGISEVTVGYLVHLLLPGMGWMFYYPLAYGFMWGAHRQTGKSDVVIACAILCASIKLLNLPMSPRMDYVINPAVSIVLEGFIVAFAFYWARKKDKPAIRYGMLPFLTSAGWRGLYLIYLALAPAWINEVSVLYQHDKLLTFVTLEIVGNGLLIALFSLGLRILTEKFTASHTKRVLTGIRRLPRHSLGAASLAVVSLAILLQWIL